MEYRGDGLADDREFPVPVPPKTNFSIMFKLPVRSTGEQSRIRIDLQKVEYIFAGYQILDFILSAQNK